MKHIQLVTRQLVIGIAIAALVSACAAMMGAPQADTFNKRVVQANGLVEVAANMVPVMYEAGKISQDEARGILARLRDISTGIDAAVLLKAARPTEADVRLTATITALTVIKTQLEAKAK